MIHRKKNYIDIAKNTIYMPKVIDKLKLNIQTLIS